MHCGHFLHGLYINIRLQNTDLQQVTPKTLDNLLDFQNLLWQASYKKFNY